MEEQVNPDTENPGIGSFIWELARVVIIAFVVMLAFRLFVAEPFIVSGNSMVPNFHNREYLIINKIGYRLNEPQRGDVIVFKYPRNPSEYFIKRVIGLPGEKVQIADGRVTIYNQQYPQGQLLEESFLPRSSTTLGGEGTTTLGLDEYFVLGDNRAQSSDSRVWGSLPRHLMVGKVWLRVFPLGDFGIIKSPALGF